MFLVFCARSNFRRTPPGEGCASLQALLTPIFPAHGYIRVSRTALHIPPAWFHKLQNGPTTLTKNERTVIAQRLVMIFFSRHRAVHDQSLDSPPHPPSIRSRCQRGISGPGPGHVNAEKSGLPRTVGLAPPCRSDCLQPPIPSFALKGSRLMTKHSPCSLTSVMMKPGRTIAEGACRYV